MEKQKSNNREKRMRLEEIIPDDEMRTEMLSRLYKGDPILGDKGIFTNLLQSFVNAALEGEMDNFLEESKVDSLANRRNGHTSKSLRSTAGPLSIQTPRDIIDSVGFGFRPFHLAMLYIPLVIQGELVS